MSRSLRNQLIVKFEICDAPSECDGVNLLKNRRTDACLGAFDGRVAAHVVYQDRRCFITTNSFYIPVPADHTLPAGLSPALQLRKDMRWGPDDPFSWPQQFVEKYPHLACIPRPPRTRDGIEERGIIWWNPTQSDFVSASTGLGSTRGLGKLAASRLSSLSAVVHRLLLRIESYRQTAASADQLPLFGQLSAQIQAVLDRLQLWLELSALLDYMGVYRPRMFDPMVKPELPHHLIGAFTDSPEFAQRLHRASIPFLADPTTLCVQRRDHSQSRRALVAGPTIWSSNRLLASPLIPAPRNFEERIWAHHYGHAARPWYNNPLLASRTPVAIIDSPTARSRKRASTTPLLDRVLPPVSHGRDKFCHFDSAWMASAIPTWETALKNVDRTRASQDGIHPINLYVCPEPALIVSPDNDERRQLLLHHYTLIRDALLFWMGKTCRVRTPGSKARQRSATIEDILRPALNACGVHDLSGFPVPQTQVPFTSELRAKEITWELAEMNFRLELLALDARASGLGFAATSPVEKLPYLLHLARLMRDWVGIDRGFILWFEQEMNWDETSIQELEKKVTTVYTQTFYDYFGRAAVIPLRLEHDLT
ncbi:hypothetical protein C8F01DRAFT_1375655 [Mycena amicta]|nr:hypothetical protein C8F01DRAFT_1375655 [Mycena amicta]